MEPAPESPEAPSDAILEVRGLEVTFATDRGAVKAADGVSFDLKPGLTLGLVGESGSAKPRHTRRNFKCSPFMYVGGPY